MATKKFDELRAKIDADPARRERVEAHKREAVAEHLEYALGELRAMRKLTQNELARALETSQPVISRLERQEGADPHLSTLRSYIEACGGRLELVAVFGDEEESFRVQVPARGLVTLAGASVPEPPVGFAGERNQDVKRAGR